MKQCMNFAKGMIIGVVSGMAMAVTLKCMIEKNKRLCKKTDKATKAINDIMEDIQALIK